MCEIKPARSLQSCTQGYLEGQKKRVAPHLTYAAYSLFNSTHGRHYDDLPQGSCSETTQKYPAEFDWSAADLHSHSSRHPAMRVAGTTHPTATSASRSHSPVASRHMHQTRGRVPNPGASRWLLADDHCDAAQHQHPHRSCLIPVPIYCLTYMCLHPSHRRKMSAEDSQSAGSPHLQISWTRNTAGYTSSMLSYSLIRTVRLTCACKMVPVSSNDPGDWP